MSGNFQITQGQSNHHFINKQKYNINPNKMRQHNLSSLIKNFLIRPHLMNTQEAMQQAQADQQTATSREHNGIKTMIKQYLNSYKYLQKCNNIFKNSILKQKLEVRKIFHKSQG